MTANDLHAAGAASRGGHRRVAVIGAGPFGLAVAAALTAAKVDLVLLGPVMSFWKENVPRGTRLLSGPNGLSFSRDDHAVSAYQKEIGRTLSLPISDEDLIAYGMWYQRRTCPADERMVAHLGRLQGWFKLQLEDGDEITADRVVIAVGMKPFAFLPSELSSLFPRFASHSSNFHDLARFRGKRLAIIGSGQSALECAALLAEQDAEIEVIARSQHLPFRDTGHLEWSARPAAHGIGRVLDFPRATLRRLLDDPDFFRRLPAASRRFLLKRTLRTAISGELKSRLEGVRFTLGQRVVAARVEAERVELQLDDRSARSVDHVLLATGYKVEIDALAWLEPELRREIRKTNGYPELNHGMESSVQGLYFVGAAAAWNFGPIMWFVRSAPWSAQRISGVISRRYVR
jgi:FAD-dependent urate hydroxylase